MFGISFTVFWLIVLAGFAILEFVTAGTIVSIWFCAGAFAAWLTALAGMPLVAQTVIFVVVSVLLLIILRPFVNKHLHKNIIETNAKALIGAHCIVEEEINNINLSGTVKADGKLWTARSEYDNNIIPVGTEVKIVAIKGVKLIVKTTAAKGQDKT